MLAETVREAGRRFGERPAIVTEGGWALTYRELDRMSDEAAAGLAASGVREGDVVATVLPPSPEHYVAYLGAAKLGAITAAVNPKLAAGERDRVLDQAGPVVVVATEALCPSALPNGARPAVVELSAGPETVLASLRVRADAPALRADPSRPIAIVFTSGTTGTPKGAVFGGAQISFITETDVGREWGGGGPALTGTALSHLGPMTKLAGVLRRGSTQYLTSEWRAADALARLAELRVEVVAGVPTQLALMLRVEGFDRYDLSCVRAIVVGGGPATPALIREARERFDAPLAVRYSCTEAGIGTGTGFADPPEDAEVSVGRGQPGVRVRVVGADGADVAPGEVGEVVLDSPAVMSGYWHDPEGSARAFAPGGGVRTGDLGWLDESGRLRLAGRSTERYVRGGYNIHPMEVEAVLADHPDVVSVVVVGRSDPVMGELGVAVVVARPGRPAPTLDALRAFGQGKLASYKLPDEVVVVDALPLTAMEKVDRRALAAQMATD